MAEEEKKTTSGEETGDSSSFLLPRQHLGFTGMPNREPKAWPELVGLTTEEAEKKIKEDMPRVRTAVVPEGSCVTMDFRTDRVRIYVDSAGKVARPPKIG